jgi:excisionase family DNA binding protein
MPEKLYDYKQLAELTGFPVGTLRTWVMQGRLKSIKFGSRVKFTESYIDEVLKKGVPDKNGNF